MAWLPSTLREEVMNDVLGKIVSSIPIFSSSSREVLYALVGSFHSRLFLPGDRLAMQGEPAVELYVIEKGRVELTPLDRSVTFAFLTDGDYMGEACLLKASKRTCSAYSVGYTDVYFLTRKKFKLVAIMFPDECRSICDLVERALEAKALANQQRAAELARAAEEPAHLLDVSDSAAAKLEITGPSEVSPASVGPEAGRGPFGPLLHCWARFWTTVSSVMLPGKVIGAGFWGRQLWALFIVLVVLWNAVMIPLRFSFATPPALFVLDYLLDGILWIDVYLNWTVFSTYAHGELLLDPHKIRAHYRNTRARADMLILVPYDLLALACLASVSPADFAMTRAVLRLPKILLLLRLPYLCKQVEPGTVTT